MIKEKLTLSNKYGLHTRAAAKLVALATRFHSDITILGPTETFNCKSIMALLTLGATCGSSFDLVITGHDEAEAATAILQLIQNRFGEEE